MHKFAALGEMLAKSCIAVNWLKSQFPRLDSWARDLIGWATAKEEQMKLTRKYQKLTEDNTEWVVMI